VSCLDICLVNRKIPVDHIKRSVAQKISEREDVTTDTLIFNCKSMANAMGSTLLHVGKLFSIYFKSASLNSGFGKKLVQMKLVCG